MHTNILIFHLLIFTYCEAFSIIYNDAKEKSLKPVPRKIKILTPANPLRTRTHSKYHSNNRAVIPLEKTFNDLKVFNKKESSENEFKPSPQLESTPVISKTTAKEVYVIKKPISTKDSENDSKLKVKIPIKRKNTANHLITNTEAHIVQKVKDREQKNSEKQFYDHRHGEEKLTLTRNNGERQNNVKQNKEIKKARNLEHKEIKKARNLEHKEIKKARSLEQFEYRNYGNGQQTANYDQKRSNSGNLNPYEYAYYDEIDRSNRNIVKNAPENHNGNEQRTSASQNSERASASQNSERASATRNSEHQQREHQRESFSPYQSKTRNEHTYNEDKYIGEPSFENAQIYNQKIHNDDAYRRPNQYQEEYGVNEDYPYYEDENEEPDRLSVLLQQTKFSCVSKKDGYYADENLKCEVFHFCQDKVKHSWLCPNGSSFHQIHLICMPPSEENMCDKSSDFHFVNDYLYKEAADSTHRNKTYVQRYYPEGYGSGTHYNNPASVRQISSVSHLDQPGVREPTYEEKENVVQRQKPHYHREKENVPHSRNPQYHSEKENVPQSRNPQYHSEKENVPPSRHPQYHSEHQRPNRKSQNQAYQHSYQQYQIGDLKTEESKPKPDSTIPSAKADKPILTQQPANEYVYYEYEEIPVDQNGEGSEIFENSYDVLNIDGYQNARNPNHAYDNSENL